MLPLSLTSKWFAQRQKRKLLLRKKTQRRENLAKSDAFVFLSCTLFPVQETEGSLRKERNKTVETLSR